MKKAIMKKTKSVGAKKAKAGAAPSKLIDAKIKELGDWRGATLAKVRAIIKQADPEVVEQVKWRGVPVWEHAGIICTGETYKAVVKMTFAKGASLDLAAQRLALEVFKATAARMSACNAFSSILSPSRISMARRVLPSRLELKRLDGSSNAAPLAKVSFTTAL